MIEKQKENITTLPEMKEAIEKARKDTEVRAKKFERYFNFVLDGDQWYNDEIEEKKANQQDYYAFNNSEDYFEQYLSRLFPRNPHTGAMEVGVSVLHESIEKRQKYEDLILSCYSENFLNDILIEQAQNFLIGGSACFFYPPDGFGSAEIISVNPQNCYLTFNGRKLEALAIYDDEEETYTFITEDYISTIDKRLSKILDEKENKAGFIPFSWIPQMPKAHSMEGRSKIGSLWELDRAYNKVMSDFANRTDENTIPHRVIFSSKAKADNIQRGKAKTTVLGQDDDMKNLELKEGKEILDFAKEIYSRIQSKTALVDTQGAIKSAVSGLSLNFQYSGMLDKIAFMRVYWDKAFKELNSAILQYAGVKGDVVTKPVYNPSIFYDTKEKTKEIIEQVDAGLMSRRDAIDYLQGDVNADEKLKEIEEEKKFEKNEKENNNF